MKLIAFDESGNTGADLLNVQQPVFVLASANLDKEEAEDLLSCVYTQQAREAKFINLKKSNSGKKKIITFLEKVKNKKQTIKTFFFHKRYMVVTKIVDVLIETLAFRDGIDLYKDGMNIALANLHYCCMPVFCGTDRTQELYAAFVNMIRTQDNPSIDRFFYAAWQVYSACYDEKYQSSLAPILASEELIHEILRDTTSRLLDPAIPAFFSLCANWGDELEEYFDVLHDKSKPIFQEKDTLELLMLKEIPFKEIGYDRRKHGFPLKANGINFGDSKHDPRLQVVDLIASSSSYWANGLALENTDDEFWKQLDEIDIEDFKMNALWPSSDVTPTELGTDGGDGINMASHIAEQVRKLKNQ